jgi:hypothetical protein
VQLTFWFLVLLGVLATGLVSRALTWDGTSALVTATVAGAVALGAILLALRMVVVTVRHRQTPERDDA